jgi:hypothetical protein
MRHDALPDRLSMARHSGSRDEPSVSGHVAFIGMDRVKP